MSGTVDGVFQMGSEGQHRACKLAEATAAAHSKAVEAGARPSSCKVSTDSSSSAVRALTQQTAVACRPVDSDCSARQLQEVCTGSIYRSYLQVFIPYARNNNVPADCLSILPRRPAQLAQSSGLPLLSTLCKTVGHQ